MGRALVAVRVLEEILWRADETSNGSCSNARTLVVVLGIVPGPRLGDLSGDLLTARVDVVLLDLSCHAVRDLLLLGRVIEDGRTVLWSANRAQFKAGRKNARTYGCRCQRPAG